MKIYLDTDFRCHVHDTGDLYLVETDFFDDKCTAFIEGYRFVPAGQTWTRADGKKFSGEMIAPAINYSLLESFQNQHEEDEAVYLAELGALIEEIYNEDLEEIG